MPATGRRERLALASAGVPFRLKVAVVWALIFLVLALFFYIAHFYLLALCAFAFFREPASLEGAYAVWAAVLVALYPLCAWYRKYKTSKPSESLWRLF